MSAIHVNYGHAKRRHPNRPRCDHCGKRRTWLATCYFGALYCRDCWDGWWRTTEDGAIDPPFDSITRQTTGEWVA